MTAPFLLVFKTQQIREIENHIINQEGVNAYELMKLAGQAIYEVIQKEITERSRPLYFLCGKGNNGGDAYIAAALAKQAGLAVICIEPKNLSNQPQEASKARALALESGVTTLDFDSFEAFPESVLIIDGILGIGARGKVEGAEKELIYKVNQARLFGGDVTVIAVDIPSGLEADSGEILDTAIIADYTVTFLALKTGLFTENGRKLSGKIALEVLKESSLDLNSLPASYHILPAEASLTLLPERELSAHKGDFGHLLIIGGDYGMGGAVILAAEAAAKAGAGKVTVLTRAEHVTPLLSRLPYVMTAELKEKANWSKIIKDKTAIPLLVRLPYVMTDELKKEANWSKIIKDKTAIIIGPGLGQSEWSKNLLDLALASELPIVIDADALNLLSVTSKRYRLDRAILTPHPAEAARLLKINTSEVQNNRLDAIKRLREKYKATFILKGSGSLVFGDSEKILLCPYGNPAMAAAGMGDVLSGIVGAFLAQGLSQEDAAILATNLHSLTADYLVAEAGQERIVASDISAYLPQVMGLLK